MLSELIEKKRIISEGKKKKQSYEFGITLGAGSFGSVRIATHIVDNKREEVAVKSILKPSIEKTHHLNLIETEIKLLKSVDHPNIVKFIDSFETKHNIYIVTQLATGGELFDRIIKKTRFTEYDAASIILQILSAIEYLHSKGIVHRDIKPENILYLTPDEDSQVVLADFGIAQQVSDDSGTTNKKLFGVAGTFGYIAPEIYAGTGEYGDYYGLGRNGYTSSCDIWSLGSLTYLLMAGRPVIDVENAKDFLETVKHNDFVWFDHKYWDNISQDAKDFITICLDIDNNRRPGAKELLQHPWILNHIAKSKTAGAADTESISEPNIIENIKTGFNATKKLQKAVRQVIIMKNLERLREIREKDDSEANEDDDSYSYQSTNPEMASAFKGLDMNEKGSSVSSSSSNGLGSLISGTTSTSGAPSSPEQRKERKSAALTSAFHNLVKAARENKEDIEETINKESTNQ